MQKKYGADKVKVLLVSVDVSYGLPIERCRKEEAKIYKRMELDWPSVRDPEGWAGVRKQLNSPGYGTILVGPDGKVESVRYPGLEKLPELDLAGSLQKLLGSAEPKEAE